MKCCPRSSRGIRGQPRCGGGFRSNEASDAGKNFCSEYFFPGEDRAIRDYGADLVIEGERYADALAACEDWQKKSGATSVHAYDQDETMLGQGTLGLEFAEQAPDIDTLLVAVGGGGLIAGIAAWYAGPSR